MIVKHLTERKVLRASNMRRRIRIDMDINYIDIHTEIGGYWTDTLNDTDNIDIIISRFYTSPRRAYDLRAGGINIGAVANGVFYFNLDYGTIELETIQDEYCELMIEPDTIQRLRRYTTIDRDDFRGNWFEWEEDYLTIGKQIAIEIATTIEIVGHKESIVRETFGIMESIFPDATIKGIVKVENKDAVILQNIINETDFRVIYIKGIDIKNKPLKSLEIVKEIYNKYSGGCGRISTRVWRYIVDNFYRYHTEDFKSYVRNADGICALMKQKLLKGNTNNIHNGYIYEEYITDFYNYLKNKAGDRE